MLTILRYSACALVLAALAACDTFRPLPEADSSERTVEVAIFKGGYGIEWHTEMAAAFSAERDDVQIDLWGDPRTADIIKPRLLSRTPPDLILDERLPIWLLIAADELIPFDDALAKPPPGSDRPWGDTFAPGMLDMYAADGHVYAIPAAYGAWLVWYDATLFREHGWTAPETWQEFRDLCQQMKDAGIAPIAMQGKYASFYAWNTLVSVYHRVGGLALINRINALEPGAFSHPDAVEAARLMQDLCADYMQQGAMAMTHTDSQLEFVTGKAGLVFCGVWLENEMKNNLSSDFEMRCFTVPPVEGGKGAENLLHGQGMEILFVPKAAQSPDAAFEFARYMVSPAAAPDMGKSIGVISPLAGATPRDAVSPALQSALDVIETSVSIFNVRARDLLPEWRGQVMNQAISDLLRGAITPEAFGKQLDAGIEVARNNPDIIIPPYTPYDAAALGEAP